MTTAGARVEHAEFGPGTVQSVLGKTATVDFFGEMVDVDVGELVVRAESGPAPVPTPSEQTTDVSFRQSFEAINLGVVPADPEQLVKLTIGGDQVSDSIRGVLADAGTRGACRVYMGYYGSGKSHHLRLLKAIALREGWVTASLELDPKAADPAKPSTVYQELVSNLTFPIRDDGSRSADFFDLVKEMRSNWATIRSLKYFRSSPWFSKGVAALLPAAHRRDDADYVSGVSWLAGQVKLISVIRSLSWRAGLKDSIPSMPQTKDTGLIYAFHLVVIHEVLQALGYRGLAIIIDEAEHVRSYSANRYVRANNFLDVLARCAHLGREDLREPASDYPHLLAGVPPFWKEGPHFGLFVGLTEGEDTLDLNLRAGEMSVLIHSPEEVVRLLPPGPIDYEGWSLAFLAEAAKRLGPKVGPLADAGLRARLAKSLRREFERTPSTERLLRNWTKMAGLAPCVLMSRSQPVASEELVTIVERAAREMAGEVLPWND